MISAFGSRMRTSVQRREIVFGTLFVIGLIAIGWQEYYRKSPMLAVVGLPGPRGNSERKCDGIYSHRKYWQLPRRYVMCRGSLSRFGRHYEGTGVDALTRQVFTAHKSWLAADSLDWVRQRDSVARAFVARGGDEFKCAYADTLPAPSQFIYWRFPEFYLGFAAVHNVNDQPPSFALSLYTTRRMFEDCLHPRHPDPEYEGCSHALVKIPIGFDWSICWREPLWG